MLYLKLRNSEFFWRRMFEVVRTQMHNLAENYPLSSPIVVKKSVQLDRIHNRILKIEAQKKQKTDCANSRPE